MSEVESGPLLDLGKRNSTSALPADIDEYEQADLLKFFKRRLGSRDGRFDCQKVYSNLYFQAHPEAGEDDPPTAPYRCKQWACFSCGYWKRQSLVEEVKRVCSERPQLRRFLTLTLDPAKVPADQEAHRYLTKRWNALLTRLSRRYGERVSFIWVREEQDSGNPHLHIIVDRFIPQQWISRTWSELGGGEIVHIERIERTEKTAHYLGKYLTKDALHDLPKGIDRYGSSQDIDLEVPKTNHGESDRQWNLVLDDYELADEDGPLTRGVVGADFIAQRENGGPLGLEDWPPPD